MKKVILKDAVYINPRRIINKGDLTPYIPMSNLEENKRKIQKVEEREYEGSGSRFMDGDILFARITPCLENGKTAFVDVLSENEVAHGSTEFIVFRGKEGVTDNLFVYYLARSDRFRRYAIKSMTGTSGRQRVQIGSIENYEFQLPSLDKQKRIAHILGTLDDKIELNQRMNETLESIARAIFKSWFVDFDPVHAKMADEPYPLPDAVMTLFPDELVESELGMIPKGWEIKPLGDVAKVNDKIIDKYYSQNEIQYVNITSVTEGVVNNVEKLLLEEAPIRAKRLVKHGDVIWSSVRPNRKSFALISHPPENLVVSTGFGVLSPIKIPSSFLYSLVTQQDYVNYLVNHATGSAYPAVKPDIFKSYRFALPCQELLNEFDKKIKLVNEKKYLNNQQTILLATIRDLSLPNMICGEIKV